MTPAVPSFVRQEDEPLYPKILYNRPITRQGAGRLLVVGGHSGEFSMPTAIHQLAMAAGIGECQVVLPDNLAKLLGGAPGTFFVASSSSGSLGREALGRIIELGEEADALAIGASLSSNSNTSMLIEKLVAETDRPLIIFDEALTALQHNIAAVTNNPKALVILTMTEVFKLCGKLGIPIQIRQGAGLINKLEIIQDLAAASACDYAVFGTEIIIASRAKLVVTPMNYHLSLVPALFYGVLGTFWLQNPNDRYAGLTTGAYVIHQASTQLSRPDHPAASELARVIEDAIKHDSF